MAGRLTSVTAADSSQTSYTYYNDGRKATETDPGHTTTYNYDAAGRLISTVDAQTHTTAYAYAAAGNQTLVTDANLHKTQSQYDTQRRMQKTTYNDATTTQYTYDGPGNQTSVLDQARNTVQYTYDAANLNPIRRALAATGSQRHSSCATSDRSRAGHKLRACGEGPRNRAKAHRVPRQRGGCCREHVSLRNQHREIEDAVNSWRPSSLSDPANDTDITSGRVLCGVGTVRPAPSVPTRPSARRVRLRRRPDDASCSHPQSAR